MSTPLQQRIEVRNVTRLRNDESCVALTFLPLGRKRPTNIVLSPGEADQLAYALQSASGGQGAYIVIEFGERRKAR